MYQGVALDLALRLSVLNSGTKVHLHCSAYLCIAVEEASAEKNWNALFFTWPKTKKNEEYNCNVQYMQWKVECNRVPM